MNVDDIMKTVNENYAKNVNIKFVFGEPIEKEGITIIPVAKVAAKVGEGNTFNIKIGIPSYHDKTPKDGLNAEQNEQIGKNISKLGYGIDAKLTPIGYIEIKNGKAEFKPILDLSRIALAGICYASVVVFFMTRMITRIAKICCKNKCKCDNKDGKDSCCKEKKEEKNK